MTRYEPRHTHDCDECTFLGPWSGGGVDYDLYFCLQADNKPTVIARYGDDGPAYTSGLTFAWEGAAPSLVEAYRRAVARGLMTERVKCVGCGRLIARERDGRCVCSDGQWAHVVTFPAGKTEYTNA